METSKPQQGDETPATDIWGLERDEEARMVTCIEDCVERLEEVLQHLECELSGINEKMEDIKIEVWLFFLLFQFY